MNNLAIQANIVRFSETGDADVLKIENVAVPFPMPQEVRIQVKAFALNRADVMFRTGFYNEQPVFPSKIGYEAAGIVEAVGAEVTGISVGDKVSVLPAFLLKDYGTYGELILAPAYAVTHYPKSLSFEEAASLWTSYLSMYGLLIDAAGVEQGQSVLINAASSSAGLAAIQITNAIGGISIAVTSSAAKKDALLKAGAAHVIVSTEEDLTSKVMQVTGGKGADTILDPVAGPGFAKLMAAVAERGQIFVYGALNPESTSLPVLDLLFKCPTIKGYTALDVLGNGAVLEKAIKFVSSGVADGKLKPVVARIFPFEQVVDATRYMESNQQTGKIVVAV